MWNSQEHWADGKNTAETLWEYYSPMAGASNNTLTLISFPELQNWQICQQQNNFTTSSCSGVFKHFT